MLSKSTDELNHEIRNATDMEDYLKRNKGNMITSSLSEHLNLLLSQKGIKKQMLYAAHCWIGHTYTKYFLAKNSIEG